MLRLNYDYAVAEKNNEYVNRSGFSLVSALSEAWFVALHLDGKCLIWRESDWSRVFSHNLQIQTYHLLMDAKMWLNCLEQRSVTH